MRRRAANSVEGGSTPPAWSKGSSANGKQPGLQPGNESSILSESTILRPEVQRMNAALRRQMLLVRVQSGRPFSMWQNGDCADLLNRILPVRLRPSRPMRCLSNGKTLGSEPRDRGSIPCIAANQHEAQQDARRFPKAEDAGSIPAVLTIDGPIAQCRALSS